MATRKDKSEEILDNLENEQNVKISFEEVGGVSLNLSKEDSSFIVERLLDRIATLKKRIDRLLFLYITFILFGAIYRSGFKEVDFIWNIKITTGNFYHLIITVALTIIFALIGSHLIEYSVKRNILDKILIGNKSFKDKGDISKTLIPGSFYEFMYSLDFYKRLDLLRELSAILILFCLYSGHYVALKHLSYVDVNAQYIVTLSIWGLSILMASHYFVFVKSHARAREKLGIAILWRVIIAIPVFIAFVIAFKRLVLLN